MFTVSQLAVNTSFLFSLKKGRTNMCVNRMVSNPEFDQMMSREEYAKNRREQQDMKGILLEDCKRRIRRQL